jgi:hypothetical protein
MASVWPVQPSSTKPDAVPTSTNRFERSRAVDTGVPWWPARAAREAVVARPQLDHRADRGDRGVSRHRRLPPAGNDAGAPEYPGPSAVSPTRVRRRYTGRRLHRRCPVATRPACPDGAELSC